MTDKGDIVFVAVVGATLGAMAMCAFMAYNGLSYNSIKLRCAESGYIDISQTVRVKCSVETLEWSEPTKEPHD